MKNIRNIILKLIVSASGMLPVDVRSLLGQILGFLFSFLPTKENRIARLQMDLFISDMGGSIHLRKMYAGLGQTALESLNLKPMVKAGSVHVRHLNPELFARTAASQRGTVALSAHLGNWELLAASAAAQGVQISAVGREARNSLFQPILEQIRSNCGVESIWRDDLRSASRILRILKSGGTVAVLIDQDTSVKSVHIPFFGLPAKTPSAVIEIAKKAGAEIVASFIIRVGFNTYQTEIHKLDERAPVDSILSEYTAILEGLIKKYPSQWVWLHKRWRTLPNGDKMPSKEYISYLTSRLAACEHG